MKILFIQRYLPEPSSGGRMRAFSLMSELRKEHFDIDLVVRVAEDEIAQVESLRASLSINIFPVLAYQDKPSAAAPLRASIGRLKSLLFGNKLSATLIRTAASIYRRLPALMNMYPAECPSDWLNSVEECLSKLEMASYEAIIIDLQSIRLMRLFRRFSPLYVNAMDILSDYYQRDAFTHKLFSSSRLISFVEAIKWKLWETVVLKRAAVVMVVSALDKERISRHPRLRTQRARVIVVPNGVDTQMFRSAENPFVQNPFTIVFSGLMHYEPNRDAISWFLSTMWPRLLVHFPDLSLIVVGANPPLELVAQAHSFDNVTFTGRVASAVPFIQQASVVIAPLRKGGGTRLKVIEAAACERAIVATSIAAEGLEHFVSGQHYLLGDTPEQFVFAIATLLTNPTLRRTLGEQARLAVKEHFDWRVVAKNLVSFLRESEKTPPG
jgi:glycosyltransferase involved in cell wall biosynthesis